MQFLDFEGEEWCSNSDIPDRLYIWLVNLMQRQADAKWGLKPVPDGEEGKGEPQTAGKEKGKMTEEETAKEKAERAV